MSMELMVKAMNIKVGNPLRKLVLLKLADNASDHGECWPSHGHIATQCEMSKTSVRNHIRDLVKAGLVKKIERRKSANESASNLYVLTLEGIAGDDTGVCQEMTGGIAGDDTGVCQEMTPEPVTLEPVIESIKSKQKKKAAKRKFETPVLVDVEVYASSRGRSDLAKKFFDYYDAGDWMDAKGNQVKNWKQKFITWENSNPNHQGKCYGTGNQQSGAVGRNESESQRRSRLNREHTAQQKANGFNGSRSTSDHF